MNKQPEKKLYSVAIVVTGITTENRTIQMLYTAGIVASSKDIAIETLVNSTSFFKGERVVSSKAVELDIDSLNKLMNKD